MASNEQNYTDNAITFIKYQCDRYAKASTQALEEANRKVQKNDWTYEQKIQYAIERIDDLLGERP